MSTLYRTSQGDTLDWICWKFYGQQSGAVELVLDANPSLGDRGPIYDAGLEITLPELVQPPSEVQPLRLWG